MAKGTGTKLSAEKEAVLSKELTIEKKYQCLQALSHPRMQHVEKVYITENGNFHFSDGNELTVSRTLDPTNDDDSKIIARTGKKFAAVKLPGKYISRAKVVDEISVEDFMEDKEEIITAYATYLDEQREKKKKGMVEDPDPLGTALAEAIRNIGKK